LGSRNSLSTLFGRGVVLIVGIIAYVVLLGSLVAIPDLPAKAAMAPAPVYDR
jgi:hypothetical protein